MDCIYCKKGDTRVLESRDADKALRRRRECTKCLKRFTTYERAETTNILVVKRSGGRQSFSREKLRKGILFACQKRPVTAEQIEKLLSKVEDKVKQQKKGEISSTKLGEMAMKLLKRLDKVAYIRFASVYLDFKDPEDFQTALEAVQKRGKK